MAALAIPIVILGSLYILSEQEKDEENNLSKKYQKVSYENFYNTENMNNNTENYSNNIWGDSFNEIKSIFNIHEGTIEFFINGISH